jgi:trk system potassium uptake protein TrkH
MVLRSVLVMLSFEAGALCIPFAAALALGERREAGAFLCAIAISLAPLALLPFARPASTKIHAREGYAIAALGWTAICLAGAAPFWICGTAASFIDAIFESVSGFTATCATVIGNVESLPRSILVWRTLIQWLGGMGVVLFLLIASPFGSGQPHVLAAAELSGLDNEKAAPKAGSAALALYSVYAALTALHALYLLLCGVPLADALSVAFATISTGGYSLKNAGLAAYGSQLALWGSWVFMFVAGLDIGAIYTAIARRRPKALLSEQTLWYAGSIALSSAAVAFVIAPGMGSAGRAAREAAFASVSVATTTGYMMDAYAKWPLAAKSVLAILMFAGACAGSTCGGIKTVRLALLFKEARRCMRGLLSPKRVERIRFNGVPVDEAAMSSAMNYFALYCAFLAASFAILSFDGLGASTTASAALACLGNAGPGLSSIGSDGVYSSFSPLSKAVLAADMLLGRLEIFPAMALFSRETWRKGF